MVEKGAEREAQTVSPDKEQVARWQEHRRRLARKSYGERLATVVALLHGRVHETP